ncbi:substrate-binding domain-containing protein [Curtobacterium sp. VKM Ac-1376]|uniref:substrate-binding domain-containing protein n=1 Tax=Curtobacterium sp. VKM Ac-1376 TaxID=123312 RepID=UPI00188D23C7|nr:substrate-binding domain-containing protein [Curtobacterium sp. VKM Ac-1376]MBF4615929.1 substrate-binding domain-containing protein [Curtobacterium sp. VKM Ac-1376]
MGERVKAPAVAHAVAVLSLIAERARPMTVTTVARELELPRTSVDRACEALRVERLLTRGTDGTYWLGPEVAALGATARATRPRALTFGVLVPDQDNAYYSAFLTAAGFDVAATGDRLVVRSAGGSVRRQRAQWVELLDAGADVVLVDSVATHGFEDLVDGSRDRGVPVVAIGTRIGGVDVSVTSDNVEAGVLAGLQLARALPPGARIAVVDGLQKNANAERIAGFLDVLGDFPDLHFVARARGRVEDEESGRAVIRDLTAEHGDLDGVFAVCDPLALGVHAELVGRPHRTLVTSVDGRSRAVQEIMADDSFVATVAQDPAGLARSALVAARDLSEGHWSRQRVVTLPVRVVSRADAERYESWG